ncbi:TetR/AcrR family transcriptional regulator [Actinomadura graeca]|uniref:TetR/AcrR family transcriptional regulator n=1 Tax=Actinomadura graeca TaxID=2750812 RepID=A0ABX8R851_9ACTN|nr:TetR/AcrR family transcriptional regulator [Actinomadura graeca]QXJ26152.1 TetR/AcrR family transcriptional regulator [Actinomadura graeca]
MSGGPASEDLTARARIRDAALRLFADRGIDRVTLRDIARSAGVSAGLVRHHFGAKAALRDACDLYAIKRLIRIKEQAVVEGRIADPGFLPAVNPTTLLLHRYLGRSMMDGSPAAAERFDRLVDLTQEWLAANHGGRAGDLRAHAAAFVGMHVGLLVMYDHVHRALGTDPSSPEGNLRLRKGVLDLHSDPLLPPEVAAEVRAAYDRLLTEHSPIAADPPTADGVAEGEG